MTGINAVLGNFSVESIRNKTIRIAYTIHINQKIIYWTCITTNSYKSKDNLLAVFLQRRWGDFHCFKWYQIPSLHGFRLSRYCRSSNRMVVLQTVKTKLQLRTTAIKTIIHTTAWKRQ